MGYGRIWIKNEFIGTSKDLIHLNGYLLGTLYELKNTKELSDDLKHLTKDQLFNLFHNGEYEHSNKYIISGSTFTDDFSIWAYRLEDMTFILWKILRTDFFDDLSNYRQDVFLEGTLTDTLLDVIQRLIIEFKGKGIIKK